MCQRWKAEYLLKTKEWLILITFNYLISFSETEESFIESVGKVIFRLKPSRLVFVDLGIKSISRLTNTNFNYKCPKKPTDTSESTSVSSKLKALQPLWRSL